MDTAFLYKKKSFNVFETPLSAELFQVIKASICDDLDDYCIHLDGKETVKAVNSYMGIILEELITPLEEGEEAGFHPGLLEAGMSFFRSITRDVSMLDVQHVVFLDTTSILIVSTNNN